MKNKLTLSLSTTLDYASGIQLLIDKCIYIKVAKLYPSSQVARKFSNCCLPQYNQ